MVTWYTGLIKRGVILQQPLRLQRKAKKVSMLCDCVLCLDGNLKHINHKKLIDTAIIYLVRLAMGYAFLNKAD